MIRLQVMFKNIILKELLTDKTEISIGRDANNNLCIDNFAASKQHARLFKGPENKYAIEDLNSTNGTFVNGKEVMTQILSDNDQITIGKHKIHVAYQEDDAFRELKPNPATVSTYKLDPKEREKLIR